MKETAKKTSTTKTSGGRNLLKPHKTKKCLKQITDKTRRTSILRFCDKA